MDLSHVPPFHERVQYILFTIRSFFKHYLGYNPYKTITFQEWLTFPQQSLIEVTAGELYYDEINFEEIRKKFSYFPDDIWKYMYAVQWAYIGQLEAEIMDLIRQDLIVRGLFYW
jgi:hypothetical protein